MICNLIPPLKEQGLIVEHIIRESNKLDELQVAKDKTFTLLKEHRAAPNAAAVTVQVEVERDPLYCS